MSIRVLLVDDDPMVCHGLETILGTTSDLEVVGQVHDGDEVVDAVHRHHPDVVLMDVRMQRQDGVTTTALLAREPKPPKVVVLTTFDHDDVLLRALGAGAAGFLLKTTPPLEIMARIRDVAAGEGALSARSARQLVEHLQNDPGVALRRAAADLVATLTSREKDVVRLVALGRTNPQIAAELHLGEATVKSHLASATSRLGAASRVEVGVLADRAGLI